MAKFGVEVPLTTLVVPEGPERFCATCGVQVGTRTDRFGNVGFLDLVEGAGAWKEKLFCAAHLPELARTHKARVDAAAVR